MKETITVHALNNILKSKVRNVQLTFSNPHVAQYVDVDNSTSFILDRTTEVVKVVPYINA